MLASCSGGGQTLADGGGGTGPDAGAVVQPDGGSPSTDGGSPGQDGGTAADGSVGPADGGLPPPATVAGFCTQYLDASAAWLATCFGGTAANRRAAMDCDPMVSGVAAGRAVFDPVAAAACIGSIPSMPCQAGFDAWASCRAAVQGTAVAGQPCYASLDCAPAGECTANASTCPGVCRNFVAEGQACALGGASCALPSFCVNGVCTPPSGLGGPCGGASMCDPALYCDSDASPKVCKAKVPAGGSCGSQDACSGLAYCAGLFAPYVAGTCRPRPGLGEPCTPGENACQAFMACDSSSKVCINGGTAGSHCGTLGQEYLSCVQSWCDDSASPGVCKPYTAPGDPCTGQTCSLYGSCSNGHCPDVCAPP